MNAYCISLGAGVLIGLVYALLKVRSPAPPAIALIGLLGMLIGEQLSALVISQAFAAQPTTRHAANAAPAKKTVASLTAQDAALTPNRSLRGESSAPGGGL
ncbi:DUF1427 family protein [Sodalis sp. RH23]|uniref:DUF1427 family protein n=1 Tax=unclassified Sodalis (in: enterobacteria) TaxID=2636512 RepID=UPI0039B65237